MKDIYYHYCELPKSTLDAAMAAPSLGTYYNANIKGTGNGGPYDGRTHHVPQSCFLPGGPEPETYAQMRPRADESD